MPVPAISRGKCSTGGGLYLEVSPRGGKWWRFKDRFGGKDKRLSLGVYVGVSLKEARKRRDLETAEWRYTVVKTNTRHLVPLSRQALEVLRELHALTGRGRYVCLSGRTPKGDRPMSDNAVLAALRRMGIGKEEMTDHGFRAMARTLLDEELGFRPDFIEHQLAHVVRGNPMLPADLQVYPSCFGFLQNPDDRFFVESLPVHGESRFYLPAVSKREADVWLTTNTGPPPSNAYLSQEPGELRPIVSDTLVTVSVDPVAVRRFQDLDLVLLILAESRALSSISS